MSYTVAVEVSQPRDKLVALFDNVDNLAFWQKGFVSHTPESGDSGTPGAKARIKFKRETDEVDGPV